MIYQRMLFFNIYYNIIFITIHPFTIQERKREERREKREERREKREERREKKLNYIKKRKLQIFPLSVVGWTKRPKFLIHV